VGVAGVQFQLDGANLGAEDSSIPYTVDWDSTAVANGTYQLTAVARDAAGNSTPSAAVNVTVDNPVDTEAPDVQAFLTNLWNKYKDDPSAVHLTGGANAGTFGDLTSPGVAFVTGELTVPPGEFFKGAGILAIRDDYDPNVDTNNTPITKSSLKVQGTLEWTGLVIVAGWAPTVAVAPGGDVTIVGGFLAEDSVQSGGEVSLDSATVTLQVEDDFRVLYSSGIFEETGLINPIMPIVTKKVIGMREL